MDHVQIASRLAELLDRAGHLLLGQGPEAVTARVRIVAEDSAVIDLAVGGREFAVVVGRRKPHAPRCPPANDKFPE